MASPIPWLLILGALGVLFPSADGSAYHALTATIHASAMKLESVAALLAKTTASEHHGFNHVNFDQYAYAVNANIENAVKEVKQMLETMATSRGHGGGTRLYTPHPTERIPPARKIDAVPEMARRLTHYRLAIQMKPDGHHVIDHSKMNLADGGVANEHLGTLFRHSGISMLDGLAKAIAVGKRLVHEGRELLQKYGRRHLRKTVSLRMLKQAIDAVKDKVKLLKEEYAKEKKASPEQSATPPSSAPPQAQSSKSPQEPQVAPSPTAQVTSASPAPTSSPSLPPVIPPPPPPQAPSQPSMGAQGGASPLPVVQVTPTPPAPTPSPTPSPSPATPAPPPQAPNRYHPKSRNVSRNVSSAWVSREVSSTRGRGGRDPTRQGMGMLGF